MLRRLPAFGHPGHFIAHISRVPKGMGVFDSGDEVHHSLQAEPKRPRAVLAIALSPKESAQAGDQEHRTVEARGSLWPRRRGRVSAALICSASSSSSASRSGSVRPKRITA